MHSMPLPLESKTLKGSTQALGSPPPHPASAAHLDDLVEVGVLPRRVLILAEDVVYGLCGLQVAHLVLFEVEGRVVLAGEGLDVGLPERVRVGPLTQQVEGQCYVPHGLENSVLRIQGP